MCSKHTFTSKLKTEVTTSDKCPCCKTDKDKDKILHLYICSHREIKFNITVSINTMFGALSKLKTPMDIWITLRAGMGTVINHDCICPQLSGDRRVVTNTTYGKQERIGWKNILKGWVMVKWGSPDGPWDFCH